MTANGTDLAAAVTVAYVHDAEVAYSWCHSMFQLMRADAAGPRRVWRGGHIALRCSSAGQLMEARNRAVGYFLNERRADWLLWLDTDMGFAPDAVEQLIAAADPVERPVVGALCFAQREVADDGMGGRLTAATPVIFEWVRDGDLEGFEVVADYPPDTLVRCAGTGSACILIHRSVFERVAAKYGPSWYDRIPAREGSVGEDLSFCMRAAELAIPIHVHTGVRTTHLKRAWVGEVEYERQQRALEPA